MAHSPLPWSVSAFNLAAPLSGVQIAVTGVGGRQAIALTGVFGGNDEDESLANARLIAAAPDLLEAARAVVNQWDTPNWKLTEHTGVFIAALREAIAKAEGKA